MAIEIVDLPIKNGDFPLQNVCLPEGNMNYHDDCLLSLLDFIILYNIILIICLFFKSFFIYYLWLLLIFTLSLLRFSFWLLLLSLL